MSKKEKIYWKSIEEKEQSESYIRNLKNEFSPPPESYPDTSVENNDEGMFSRRSFLRTCGFSFAGIMVASCSGKRKELAIPFTNKPELLTPGRNEWYASTCGACNAGCGILTKNRDGRPIKIEGNPDNTISNGGICAVGQASLLGLYDSLRIKTPMVAGVETNWEAIDIQIQNDISDKSKSIYYLSGTMKSPTEKQLVQSLLNQYSNSKLIEYDAISYSAILDAHQRTHGKRVLPHYNFKKAKTIVSFDADFLGTWLSPVEFAKDYSSKRNPDKNISEYPYLVQFEGRLSLTGSNSDKRFIATESQIGQFLNRIAWKLSQFAGLSFNYNASSEDFEAEAIDNLCSNLWKTKGKSLVVCGVNSVSYQTIVNYINYILDNYGSTIDINQPSLQSNSNDKSILDLLTDMKNGKVNTLIISGTNPAYSLPNSKEFVEALKKVPTTIYLGNQKDETAQYMKYVCPDSHFLESWSDSESVIGRFTTTQPVVPVIGNSRSKLESLSIWSGKPAKAYVLIRAYWKDNIYPQRNEYENFDKFWKYAIHDSYVEIKLPEVESLEFNILSIEPIKTNLNTDLQISLYQKVSMFDGSHAGNPWLQELPDPISKITWDNYASISPSYAKKAKIEEGDVLNIKVDNKEIQLPAHIQPGQHPQVIAIAMGYGRLGTDRFANINTDWIFGKETIHKGGLIGKNAFSLSAFYSGNINYTLTNAKIEKTKEKQALANTQTYSYINVPKELGGQRRDHVIETTIGDYKSGHFEPHSVHEANQLWTNDFVYKGHHWGMAIDINACTGCSSCVISCQAENNISVVGKDEVFRGREMHWLRIDRYYAGDEDNPDVLFQPMMCQHCDHAPCEGVCPVLATVHSEEGLNQQIYNRCVGTRYCANNCPFKVRRFNWFDYKREDKLANLVLNPDVTVRSRGVMEKCSLCVQRIHQAKAEAKRKGIKLDDGDIKTACQQSCPSDAIIFGDMNDPESRISKAIESDRHYHLIEEMNFKTTVGYLAKIRNRNEMENFS